MLLQFRSIISATPGTTTATKILNVLHIVVVHLVQVLIRDTRDVEHRNTFYVFRFFVGHEGVDCRFITLR